MNIKDMNVTQKMARLNELCSEAYDIAISSEEDKIQIFFAYGRHSDLGANVTQCNSDSFQLGLLTSFFKEEIVKAAAILLTTCDCKRCNSRKQ